MTGLEDPYPCLPITLYHQHIITREALEMYVNHTLFDHYQISGQSHQFVKGTRHSKSVITVYYPI